MNAAEILKACRDIVLHYKEEDFMPPKTCEKFNVRFQHKGTLILVKIQTEYHAHSNEYYSFTNIVFFDNNWIGTAFGNSSQASIKNILEKIAGQILSITPNSVSTYVIDNSI